MKVTLWLVVLCLIWMGIGIITGALIQGRLERTEIMTEEIHLIIPKSSTNQLRNQLLHVSAQKAMLDEYVKWEQKLQPQPVEMDKGKRK